MPSRGCHEQRCIAAFVSGIHLGLGIQKALHHTQVATGAGGEHWAVAIAVWRAGIRLVVQEQFDYFCVAISTR